MQKIRSENIAKAASAHNKVVTDKLEAEARSAKDFAEADKIQAEADAIRNTSSIDRGRFELERLEAERKLAKKRLADAQDRTKAALWKLKEQGGDLYLPDDLDDD